MKEYKKDVFGYTSPKVRCNEDDDEEMYSVYCKGRNLRRRGNHIYFYDYIDDESQMWLQQAMDTAHQECLLENAQAGRQQTLDNIYIHINSPGGSVVSSLALYDYLRSFPQCVVGIVEGIAASGASILLCGCQLREMTANSSVLCHELRTWDPSVKKWSEVQDDYENDKYLMDKLKKIYLKETTVPSQIIDEVLKHDVYWDVNKCLEYEFCDVVVGTHLTEEKVDFIDKRVDKRMKVDIVDEIKDSIKKPLFKKSKKRTEEKAAPLKKEKVD